MNKLINKLLELIRTIPLFKDSNRDRHFLYAIPTGFLFSFIFTFGLGVGMEYKDRLNGGKFDCLDLLSTFLGGLVGQVLQLIVLYIIIK